MNKRIDYSNLGGFPLDQDTLDFMQQSYRSAFGAVAKLCGDKVILDGVVVAGGNVSAGWIAYGGELIPFLPGAAGLQVAITETVTAALFEDNATHDVEFTKVAQCGPVGAFPFSDLVRLSAIQNIWQPGDLKQKYVDNAYIAANFDVNGFGQNKELGWRILSKAVPSSAGKVFVNHDSTDTDFNLAGKTGGAKTITLDITQIPAHSHSLVTGGDASIDDNAPGKPLGRQNDDGRVSTISTGSNGGGLAHNNMQPFFVVLTLIKL